MGKMMMRKIRVALAAILLSLTASSAYADRAQWESLNAQVIQLYGHQQNAQAEEKAKESLKVAEESFGLASQEVAQSLNNLALICEVQGKLAEAETHYKEAIPIMEKALGPDHPHVGTVLENYAAILERLGKKDQAKIVRTRVRQIQKRFPK